MSRSLFLSAAAVILTGFHAFAQTPNTLTAEEQAEGWKLLFDGKTLTGMRGLQKANFLQAGWKIADGALTLTKTIDQSGKVTAGDVATAEPLSDFEFAFEWKMGVSGNSGLLYFARGGIGQRPVGHEFQLIDDVHHPEGLKGGPIRRTGALDGIIPPGEETLLNATGWNQGRLVVRGNHVEHWVNGVKALEYDLGTPAFMQALRGAKVKVPPGIGTKIKGPVLLLDQGEEVSFRSLKLRPLAPGTGGPAPAATGQPAGTATPVAGPTPFRPRVPGPTPFRSRIPAP
jgi:hypothetical protein